MTNSYEDLSLAWNLAKDAYNFAGKPIDLQSLQRTFDGREIISSDLPVDVYAQYIASLR